MKKEALQLILQIYKRGIYDIQKRHICQQTRQPRRNGKLLRNIHPTETESGRNRKSG